MDTVGGSGHRLLKRIPGLALTRRRQQHQNGASKFFHVCTGALGEESYIAPVASLAAALFEQGRNI